MSNYYNTLRDCLGQGFFADNFERIYQISFDEAGLSDRPLFPLLIWSIFYSLDYRWRPRPLQDAVARQMENALIPSILAYLDAVQTDMAPEEELLRLNQISAAYRGWLNIQAQILWGRWADR
jgi:hypothetical protein